MAHKERECRWDHDLIVVGQSVGPWIRSNGWIRQQPHSLSSFCFRCDGSSAKYTSPVAGRTGLSWVVVDSSFMVSLSLWSNQSVDAVQILVVLWKSSFDGDASIDLLCKRRLFLLLVFGCCWWIRDCDFLLLVVILDERDRRFVSWCCLDGSRRFLLSLLSTSDGSSWWKSSMDGFCFYTLVLLLVTPLHHDNLCTSS